MKLKLLILSLSLLLITAVIAPCFAAMEWSIQKKLQLETPPLDVAVSLNDKWVFVLNDRGEVLVFSSDGSLKRRIFLPMQDDREILRCGLILKWVSPLDPGWDLLYMSAERGLSYDQYL